MKPLKETITAPKTFLITASELIAYADALAQQCREVAAQLATRLDVDLETLDRLARLEETMRRTSAVASANTIEILGGWPKPEQGEAK